MIISWKPYNKNKYAKLGTYNFETVRDYIYLGTILTNKNELSPENEKRIIQIEHIVPYFLYWRASQYSQQNK